MFWVISNFYDFFKAFMNPDLLRIPTKEMYETVSGKMSKNMCLNLLQQECVSHKQLKCSIHVQMRARITSAKLTCEIQRSIHVSSFDWRYVVATNRAERRDLNMSS